MPAVSAEIDLVSYQRRVASDVTCVLSGTMPAPKIKRWFNTDALSRYFGIQNSTEKVKDEVSAMIKEQVEAVLNDFIDHFGNMIAYVLRKHQFKDKWLPTRAIIRNVIVQCPTSQKIKIMMSEHKAGEITYFPTLVFDPFEQIQMNFLGPFPVDEREYKYILVVVEMFSRYTDEGSRC